MTTFLFWVPGLKKHLGPLSLDSLHLGGNSSRRASLSDSCENHTMQSECVCIQHWEVTQYYCYIILFTFRDRPSVAPLVDSVLKSFPVPSMRRKASRFTKHFKSTFYNFSLTQTLPLWSTQILLATSLSYNGFYLDSLYHCTSWIDWSCVPTTKSKLIVIRCWVLNVCWKS